MKTNERALAVLTALFSGPRKPKDFPTTRVVPSGLTGEQAQMRYATQVWTAEEDARLKHLCHLYSLNWHLIADDFNTWRKSVSTDRRTEWDCMVRWDRMLGPTAKSQQQQQQQQVQQQAEGAEDSAPIGSRRASRSTTQQSRYKEPPPAATPSVNLQMPPPPTTTTTQGNKLTDLNRKQIRRGYLHEAIRRVMKKREASANKGGCLSLSCPVRGLSLTCCTY